MHGRKDLSIFTKKNPAPRGEQDGQIIPTTRDSVIYCSMASPSGHDTLYSRLEGRDAPVNKSMAQP